MTRTITVTTAIITLTRTSEITAGTERAANG